MNGRKTWFGDRAKGAAKSAASTPNSADSAVVYVENEEVFHELLGISLRTIEVVSHSYFINPLCMTASQAYIATQFLLHQLQVHQQILTRRGVEYKDIPIKLLGVKEAVPSAVKFAHGVACYPCGKNPEQKHFAVVGGTLLGRGENSEIWTVDGKLKLSGMGVFFYKADNHKPLEKKKAVKLECNVSQKEAANMVETYQLAKNNKNLGLKYPMWSATMDKTKALGMAVTVMRRLKDFDLNAVLATDQVRPGYLTKLLKTNLRWDMRDIIILAKMGHLQFSDMDLLRYCAAIAMAYKEQVSDLGLIHRDVKSENIIIDLAKGPVSSAITFLDYGYARRIGSLTGTAMCGTPGYIAPEVLKAKNPTSTSCDIFSLACTLAQWFGDDSAYEDFPPHDSYGYQQSANRQFASLSVTTPSDIALLLGSMVAPNPEERPSINEVIERFKNAVNTEELGRRLGAATSPSAKS